MELVSVIIPVYNGEKYIANCIESLLVQTYKQHEIIIIDDGSSDATLNIIKQYANKYPSIRFLHTENQGVSRARNAGIELAEGDYITFLDADDQLRENALEVMYNLIKSAEADISIVESIYFRFGEKPDNEYQCAEDVIIWDMQEAFQKAIEDHAFTHSAWAKMYKRELVKGIRFTEGRKINEDKFFVFQCFTKCKRVVYQNNKVYLGFVTPGSASRSAFSEKFFDILYFADRKVDIINRDFPAFKESIPAVLVRARLSLLYNLCKTYDKKYRRHEKECLQFIRKNMQAITPNSHFEKRLLAVIKYRLFKLYKFRLYKQFKKYFL